MTFAELLLCALYLSAGWYDRYARTGSVHSRAKAVVLYDRILTGRF